MFLQTRANLLRGKNNLWPASLARRYAQGAGHGEQPQGASKGTQLLSAWISFAHLGGHSTNCKWIDLLLSWKQEIPFCLVSILEQNTKFGEWGLTRLWQDIIGLGDTCMARDKLRQLLHTETNHKYKADYDELKGLVGWIFLLFTTNISVPAIISHL